MEAARRGRWRREEAFLRCCFSRVRWRSSFFVTFWFFVTFCLAPYYLITSTWEFVVYVRIYVHIWSVFGPSMSGNPDTKVSRHTKNHVAKIGLSGQNLATFRLVADMSPTCRRHYQPRI